MVARSSCLVFALGAGLLLLALPGRAVTPPPTALALTSDHHRIEVVDARTLRGVGWSRSFRYQSVEAAVLSPEGSRVAISVFDGDVLILDRATGRVVQRFDVGVDATNGLYWSGGERLTGRKPALLVGLGYDCWSGGGAGACGYSYGLSGTGVGDDVAGTPPFTTLSEGLVLAPGPQHVMVYDGGFRDITLPRMPARAPFWIVGDAARHRAFLVSSGGTVAEIDHAVRAPTVTYHSVALDGLRFRAAWASQNTIAVWGESGLRTISTADWTVKAIAPNVTAAVPTRDGVAAWTGDPADGLSIFGTDGTLRYTVLTGSTIRTARAVGHYLYVTAEARYAVDLRTGRTFGPLRSDATVIGPSLGLSMQCSSIGCG